MKKILIIFVFTLAALNIFAQTGVNTKSPNTNTYLHLDEKTGAAKIYKGVLTSRYSTVERNTKFTGLTVAENGLLIYNTTENCYNYWKHNGTVGIWVSLCDCLPGSTPSQFYVNCGGATVNPNTLTQNVNTPGFISVPIVVVSAGTINASTQSINGVTFTTPQTNITQSTTSFELNFTGAPSSSIPIVVPIKDNNGVTICNVAIPVTPNGAQFACTSPTGSAATFAGNYATGTPLDASNTMTLTVNVSVSGTYGAITYTGGGMTFSAPAGSFASIGNNTISFTGSGTPNTGGNNTLTASNTALCTANVNVTQSFSYQYTCGETTPVASSIVFTQGVPASGTFTVPITVTGTGPIPASSYTNNGITYTTPAITNATSSINSVTVTYSGSATTAGTSIFNIGSCNYPFTVNANNATYACNKAVVNGAYVVNTALTATNTITVEFDVTSAGNYPAMNYIGGGMTFTAAASTFIVGNNNVTFTGAGTPNAAGTITLTSSDPARMCSVSVNVIDGFSYTYNCSAATVSPTMVRGVNKNGTVTVPVSITGNGNIPAINNTINGVTYTFTGIIGANSGTTSISIAYSGTPNTDSSLLPMTNSNASNCNISIAHPAIAPTFSYSTACTPTNPALTTFNFVRGSAASGTFTIPLSVVGTGAIPAFTGTTSGITLTTTAIANATSGNNSLTVTISGNPTASGSVTIPLVINGTGCSYTFTVQPAFSYTYTCGATNPAASSIVFTQNAFKSGSFTIPVTVTGSGTIPSTSTISNGITYTTPTITAANSNTTVVTVTYSGTPTASGTTTLSIGACTYPFTVNQSFSYTYNCAAAAISPAMVRGVNKTGTVTVPVSVTGTGAIPAINTTINGVTYTYAGALNATSGTNSIVISYSGTPNTDSSDLPLTSSNGTNCNVVVPHPYGPAVFTSCSTQVFGTYEVERALDGTNYIIITFTGVTTPGNVNLTSQDLNGMKFSSGGNKLITSTANTVRLDPVVSATKLFTITGNSVPNTSEDVTNGNNGSNDQKTTLAVSNSLGAAPSCPIVVDVKPRTVTVADLDNHASTYGVGPQRDLVGATDGRIRLESNREGKITWYFWNVMVRNVTTSTLTYNARSSAFYDGSAINMIGSIAPNTLAGSFDPYLQTEGAAPKSNADYGAHAGNESALAQEESESGFNALIDGKYYKYRIVFNTTSSGLSTSIVLFGVHTTSPQVYQTKTAYGSKDAALQSYWP